MSDKEYWKKVREQEAAARRREVEQAQAEAARLRREAAIDQEIAEKYFRQHLSNPSDRTDRDYKRNLARAKKSRSKSAKALKDVGTKKRAYKSTKPPSGCLTVIVPVVGGGIASTAALAVHLTSDAEAQVPRLDPLRSPGGVTQRVDPQDSRFDTSLERIGDVLQQRPGGPSLVVKAPGVPALPPSTAGPATVRSFLVELPLPPKTHPAR